MHRTSLVTSRRLRACIFGFVAVTAAVTFTTDLAEARRYRHSSHHYVRHHHAESSEDSYSPQFSEIIVDANSGATLSSSNPDASRHPASLTKIMTLYLLFERLDAGKIKLDTEMPVSRHASEQDPTKLGLMPGQTIRVEDAIKGLVTRSANDAAVVIAEALGGEEDDFARMMTRKAHMLGMSKTVYRNASGLPDDEQVTTARDQATLGRAIQDRFPRYYRYFSTASFTFRGHSIANHNHLLGSVEGVDGIKTGYTRSSGFNLVTSMRRGNRHLVGVVMGGHSAGSRDAIMRNLLAENLEKASTHRTVAAITDHNTSDSSVAVASTEDAATPPAPSAASSVPPSMAPAAPRPAAAASLMSQARADASSAKSDGKTEQAKIEPAPLTNGVLQAQAIAAIPGNTEPMKPVKVKTVQIKAGQVKLASASSTPAAPPVTSAIPARPDVAETSSAVVAKADNAARPDVARTDMPPQPPGHGTGNGILGVLPASSIGASPSQAMAYADPSPPQPTPAPAKPEIVHTGWIVQVGALESESEAQQRIEAARNQAHGLLNKAEPFTEPVVAKGDRKLFRARFAGLDRDQAEAVCKTLKRSDISCMTVRN
ncbi:D-alanyl-D-alanine carboxypeptidase [Bradyrhizobium sp.]|jgi:D-alanyl-D-alanine carboxypeptidase|uniref:D-alanyl-D-alanine carboxypeptidase n=1 Tax=Bradyrhizobium sp. TaxID=376 RepID=UPI002D64AEEF|nr:D-alanyl-D-alanine carboxypeptidase [Bradyrhizobium sp.]HZR73418.1 D-alanyl-D-alanine carboxypeptidase [Bradyrhizobium sp.]